MGKLKTLFGREAPMIAMIIEEEIERLQRERYGVKQNVRGQFAEGMVQGLDVAINNLKDLMEGRR